MPKDFAVTIPEMDEVSPEREKLIAEFLQRQEAFYGSNKPHYLERAAGDERVLAYKFLTARKWDVVEAEKMFRGVIEMRKERKLDLKPLFPNALPIQGYDQEKINAVLGLPVREKNIYDRYFATVNPSYSVNFHKWDKQGHPVLIERTGISDVREVVARFKSLTNVGQDPTQPVVDFRLYVDETAGSLIRYQDAMVGVPNGRRILGFVVIMDCVGLGYGHLWRPALKLFQAVVQVDAMYYPEQLHRLYLVNCPSMIMFAFNIIKGWLDPRVIGKIIFLSPEETTETLLKVIDEENLPDFLGGKAAWAAVSATSDPLASPAGAAAGDGDTFTEDICVAAGKTFTKSFDLTAGEEVAWEFASTKDKNILFSVSWFDQSSQGERVVVEAEKLKDGSSSHVASGTGKLILTWDNSSSWFTAKKLQMRVFKMAQ
jgi:hypothetical protein